MTDPNSNEWADTPAPLDPQEAAERLRRAVRDALDARGLAGGVITEFVVVAAQSRIEDDGGTSTGVYHFTSGGVPYHRVLGLLDFTRVALRGEVHRALGGGND
jgi:hypothetical protein